MPKNIFHGLGVALVTPFKSDGSIDFDALDGLLDFHLQNGTDYLVVLGTTAETPTLTLDEQAEIVRFVKEKISKQIPIVVGVGSNCTNFLKEKIKKINLDGISAILSVTPYYNKPSQEGLFQHYQLLSQVSPLPIILYNVPGRTGVNMTAETTLRIADSCSNVIAIKEASGNLPQIKTIIDNAPRGFDVISGDDAVTTAVIEMGGIGVISVFGNAFPKEMSWLVHHALAGDAAEARQKMDSNFEHLFQLLFVEGNPAGIKCLLHLKGVIENVLRLPLTPVSATTRQLMQEEMKKIVI